jgi:hypothetical protein
MSKLERYQGREFEVTLQAPTYESLEKLVVDMESVAKNNGMGEVRVLSKGKDPDGGYKAIVVAHNWNPFKWIKRNQEMKGKSHDEQQRLKRYYRREDAIKKAESNRKIKAKLEVKAEREELKARVEKAKASKRSYRQANRLGSQYAYASTGLARKGSPRLTPRMRRLPR